MPSLALYYFHPIARHLPGPAQLLTGTRVHRNIRNLGGCAAPATRLLPRLGLGEDLRLGDGIV